jgi:hypothetical protein
MPEKNIILTLSFEFSLLIIEFSELLENRKMQKVNLILSTK